jgi:DNA gyrase/topoisomerase IV subunit B
MQNRGIYKGIEIIKITGSHKGVEVEAEFGFVPSCGKQVSFVNDSKSIDGGSHVKGLIAGIAQTIKVLSGCKLNASIWKRFISEGVLAAINVKLYDPCFRGSSRDQLTNPEVFLATKELISKQLILFLQEHESKCNKLLKNYIEQYIQFQYRKLHDGYGCGSSDFVEKLLIKSFDQPDKFKNLVKEYQEVEMYLAECQKMQDADNV